MTQPLPLLYLDDQLAVINKPADLLVHPSDIDPSETSAMVQLRDQLGQRVYPVHRLDRPTSGVLVFALSTDIARHLARQFEEQQVHKDYLAIVRGHPPLGGIIRHALTLKDDRQSRAPVDGEAQPALTLYHRLGTATLPVQVDARYPHSRYALVRCRPHTGRRHQLRRHLKHLNHPIIGDSSYGKGPHNRMFQQRYGHKRLYLHSQQLQLHHPQQGTALEFTAPLPDDFASVCKDLGWTEQLA